jgi:hypothetical protein
MSNSAQAEQEGDQAGQRVEGSTLRQSIHQIGMELLFPATVLLFVGLYVENTYGRIELSNLVYPYVIVAVLAVLTVGVIVWELASQFSSLGGEARSSDDELTESVQELAESDSESETGQNARKPLIVAAAAIAYPLLVGGVGFFPASAMTLVATMRATGVEDWRQIAVVTGGLLIGIYLLFVQILGLRLPQGLGGI